MSGFGKKELLGKICHKITDGTHKTPAYQDSGIVFLSAKNIKNGTLSLADHKYISEEEHLELTKRCKPEAGDVMLSKSGSLGDAITVPNLPFSFSIFESLALIKPKRDILSAEYLQQYLNSPLSKRYFWSITSGIAVKHLHLVDLRKMPINLPSLAVQAQITGALGIWDDAIEKTEALIAAKEKQFEWLRSHLISSSKANQTLKFGDFLTESRIPDTIQDPEKRLTVRLHLKGVSVRDYRGTESTDATKYFHRKSGQLIYGKQNVFRGSIGIVPPNLDGYSSSQDIPAFDIADNVNSKWLYWYLSRPSFYSWLENFSAGSGSKRLHPKELFKISVDLPSLEDQKRISDSLNLADKEIRLLKKTLKQYRCQKRGLMQKLLTGEWQVTSAQVGAEGELQDRTKENVA